MADKLWNLKWHIHLAMCCIVQPLAFQADRQADENPSLGDIFRIQYLAFGNYLFVLNDIAIWLWQCQGHSMNVLFFAYNICRMLFIGSSFRGVHQRFLLHNTIVLFNNWWVWLPVSLKAQERGS